MLHINYRTRRARHYRWAYTKKYFLAAGARWKQPCLCRCDSPQGRRHRRAQHATMHATLQILIGLGQKVLSFRLLATCSLRGPSSSRAPPNAEPIPIHPPTHPSNRLESDGLFLSLPSPARGLTWSHFFLVFEPVLETRSARVSAAAIGARSTLPSIRCTGRRHRTLVLAFRYFRSLLCLSQQLSGEGMGGWVGT